MLEPIKDIFAYSPLSRIFISHKISEALKKEFGFDTKVVVRNNQIKILARKKNELTVLNKSKDKVREIVFSNTELRPNIFVKIAFDG